MNMKKYSLILLTLAAMACSHSQNKENLPTSKSDDAKVGFKLRDFKTDEWPNGLQVVYIEDHSLPSVGFGLLFKDGGASDPMTKSGQMELMSQVMVRGTTKMNASQLADALGFLGTDIIHEVTDDYMWIQLEGLTPHSGKLLDLFSDVVLHPRFDPREVKHEKDTLVAAIKQRPDHPDQFADQAFDAYLYGGHPYARPVAGIERDVNSLSRKDLLKSYLRHVRPNNAVLVVTGDYTPELIGALKEKFGNWNKSNLDEKNFPMPPDFKGVNIRVIDKPDLTQSQIIIGNLGIKRSDPDYLPLRIANIILGGNFSSRLMERVRVALGLTYGINSSFDAHLDRGPFEITTFTKNKSVGMTIDESLKVLRKFYSGGVTNDEVEASKNFLMGAFPRAIETSERLGFNLALLRLYGISDDYLRNFVSNVNGITVANVNDAIKRHLNVNDLKILVLTKTSESLDQSDHWA